MEIAIIQFTPAPVTSSALGPNILYSILSSNTLNMSSPSVKVKVPKFFLFTFSILHFLDS
jgi:hypothetical protein